MKNKILKLWKEGKNVWEISVLLSINEKFVWNAINN